MQMEKAPSLRRKALHVGTVLGVAATAVIATASPSWAAAETATVSPASGKTAGGDTITLSVASQTDATNSFIQGATTVVFATVATCPATYDNTQTNAVSAANVRVITPTRLALTTPALSATGGISAGAVYSICAYNGTDNGVTPLIAKAESSFTVGPAPTSTAFFPASAGTAGGGAFTLTGTNLLNAVVSIGGVQLVSPTTTSTSVKGTIPPHSPGGPFPITVSSPTGGSLTIPRAFTYANGLTVSPNTAPNTKARADLYIKGSGFGGINFTGTAGLSPNDTGGHVYLVKGSYDPSKPTATATTKTNGQVAECLNVLAISDSELLCSLYPAGGGVAQSGGRSVTGTVSGTTLTAAAGNFTVADIGLAITGNASVGTGVYITGIQDATKATLSKAPTTAVTTATSLALTPGRTFTGAGITNTGTALTATNGGFSAADVGRAISGPGIVDGTTITAVSGATGATLSTAPVTASLDTSGNYVIGTIPTTPIPNGTYTVTVVSNGGLDVQSGGTNADASYQKTVINSGSTFTVAEY